MVYCSDEDCSYAVETLAKKEISWNKRKLEDMNSQLRTSFQQLINCFPHTLGILTEDITYCIVLREYINESPVACV